MSSISKKIIFVALILSIIMMILLNYVSSEFYSLQYGNPIKRVYLKNAFVKAEAVATAEKIKLGLAGRENIGEGRGMLFLMPQDDFQRFWMKGMQFPIDIIWIENGRVVGCEGRISQDDQRIFTSPEKSSVVLEVNAGFCEQNDVQLNDPVRIE
ncbi:MAG: hypothetical protein UX02_C0002G0158 [Candidatus Moranbacteria bacterium GW2011_GWC1_45_18]|nr:MAG: hypothetical protein UT79_C0001G0303 [Candidatus Moranbacteria bacterium GW2011_GWC2_40_12]KKT33941.1 MAG: hypothetical protein UW19_C0004G0071 [Candidatus Moranbacteria bacterium GW2011_GWF2_44_10]KKT70327.1 MAG: hypothetical protein UW66_C0044G0004 [Candidatus Moranbacteria bacterium GW2011_GWF1_44_4]KKT99839.1 MAG: hypothetical protein UX02_C0002G0158 [Candidatus Moranbacteria bacterium GW2011_GWC1_45_18]OGI23963.1 MAG: hypothetical protein A2194_04640 [Candidatus Moranbacteria bacte